MDGKDKVLMIVCSLGTVMAFTSLFRGILEDRQVQIEYLENGSTSSESVVSASTTLIYVDIEGSVVRPGVYGLPPLSRVKDALIMAGGFAEKADRSYCEKNLNLAQPLKDGQKIFIPELDDTPGVPEYIEAKRLPAMVNINTASVAELDTLWGVGPARAETIVKNRPYGSLEEAVSKGGLTKQIVERNADKIGLF